MSEALNELLFLYFKIQFYIMSQLNPTHKQRSHFVMFYKVQMEKCCTKTNE